MPQSELQLTIHTSLKQLRSRSLQTHAHKLWWGPIWRGLPVEPTGKHYRAMRCGVWLYLYLVIHADRKAGTLYRRVTTIAQEMGVSPRTIRFWLSVLRKRGYITTEDTGRALKIAIEKWKPLVKHNGT